MFKKTLISLLTIIFALIIFNNSIFAYTTEEIETEKNRAEELLKAQMNNSDEKIKNYYNSLMQTKQTLNQMILETKEGKEELQKIKYKINLRMIELEEIIKIAYIENNTTKYTGYMPILLGASIPSSAKNIEILSYKGRNISGKIAFDGGGQYTDLKTENSLFCQEHGGSLTSVSKSEANVDDGEDGTLYVTGNAGTFKFQFFTDYVGQRTEKWEENLSGSFVQLDTRIRRDEYGFYALSERYHTLEPDSVVSYGDWKCTRSIATFSSSKAKLLEGQSYILGHSEYNEGGYPSYVQQAYWLYQENLEENGTDLEAGGVLSNSSGYAEDADGAGSSITNDARQLAAEAIKIEEERLTPLGTEVENVTNMEECTVVYNLDEHCWYAGPFTLSYERKTLKTIAGATSKVEQGQNELLENKIEGLVEYRGINDIKYYDEGGNELQGVEFVIPNKQERQEGDEEYKFPYPEEEFYLKIPYEGNEDAEEFKEMEVQLFDMYSEGEGYDLDGTYYKLRWEGRKYAILCTDPGSCSRHEGQEVGHEIRVAGSCDSSCPDDCSSSHYTWEPCSGYARCYIHNGRVDIAHLESWDHYLAAADSLDGPYDAQDLLNVTEAKIGMLFIPSILSIEKDLTIRMGGTVYNDLHSGKETDNNGIKDSNEEGIKGVKVTITPITEEGESRQTYTDANGKWSIPDVKVGKYDVEFEYDGQTYKTTKYLVSKNLNNLNDSKAQEKENQRQAFNDKFYEIANNRAISVNGSQSTLQYQTSNGISKIITRDANTNIPLDLYKMQARTSNNGVYYGQTNCISISEKDMRIQGEIYDAIYPALENINLGLVKRAEADIALTVDVYQSMTMISGIKNLYTWNEREEQKEEAIIDITKRDNSYYEYIYEQEIKRQDYNLTDPAESLNVYVDYKILIRNQSQTSSVYISELASYYDSEFLEFASANDFTQSASYIVDRKNMINNPVNWTTSSNYNSQKAVNGYKAIYTTSIQNIQIGPGENIEVHIMFQVGKDAQNKLIMDEGALGKKNVVEINAYRTYENGKVEGKIDRDSNPGNVNLENRATFEDDTDSASLFKLIFQKNVDKGNMIYGNAWEDIKKADLFNEQGVKVGDLEYKFEEDKLVNNVLVELYKVDKNGVEEKIAETRTGINGLPDGNYEFTNLASGEYRVKFIYGDEYQLSYDLKYNGQDYQALNRKSKIKNSRANRIYDYFRHIK